VAGAARGALLRRGYALVVGAALVFGLIAGLLTVALLPSIGPPVWTVVGVTAASVVFSIFVLQDPVLTACGRARWLLAENIPVSLAKLTLLPVLAVLVGSGHNPVVLATVAPAAVAALVVSGVLLPRLVTSMRPVGPADAALADVEGAQWLLANRRTFGIFVLRDGVASAMNLGLLMMLPFVVTAASGAVQGAVFALCLQVSAGLDMVTAGVGVSLTTNVADDPVGGGPVAAVQMWKRLFKLVGAAAVLMILGSPVLLWIFGQTYLQHDGVLIVAVLAVGGLMRTTFEVWTALLRAQHRTGLLLACTSIGGLSTLVLVAAAAHVGGALGAAVAMTCATAGFSVVGAIGLRNGVRIPGRHAQ
jgi:O-antigen/teichoic acid export membrane protein